MLRALGFEADQMRTLISIETDGCHGEIVATLAI